MRPHVSLSFYRLYTSSGDKIALNKNDNKRMLQYPVQINETQRYMHHNPPISHRRLGNVRFRENKLNAVVGSVFVFK